MVQQLFVVGLGGALGAMARYGLSGWVQRQAGTFPLGTMVVNVVGCLILGAMMTLVEDRPALSPNTRLFVGIGLLGSFTTFSTFGFETFELLREREHWLALASVAGNLGIGLAAVVLGRTIIRAAF